MRTTTKFGATGMLVAALLALPASALGAPSKNSEALQLWEALREEANVAVTETDLLVACGRNTANWETQASQLNEIRDTLNDMGAKIARLEEVRGEIAPLHPQLDRVPCC